ncbi:hypothetical protein Syun_014393 [Stephania yunnanensis]|uniref:Uncharacterized protein n=1 Tax=Stephania yunnanensis TaxID=152371 RepID=A0AAP0JKY3_9MAGN
MLSERRKSDLREMSTLVIHRWYICLSEYEEGYARFAVEMFVKLQELALSLALKCLSFDFVGTSLDESSEEFGTVQAPSPWRPVLEDPSNLQIFFDYYAIAKPPISKKVPSAWRPVLEDPSNLQIFFDYYAIAKPHISKEVPSAWRPVLEDASNLQIFFDYYAIAKPPISKEDHGWIEIGSFELNCNEGAVGVNGSHGLNFSIGEVDLVRLTAFVCCSVDEDAKEKLAPYSLCCLGDESYSNGDLEKVGSVYAPFFLFIAICAALRPLFTGYRVSTDVPASRKTLVHRKGDVAWLGDVSGDVAVPGLPWNLGPSHVNTPKELLEGVQAME